MRVVLLRGRFAKNGFFSWATTIGNKPSALTPPIVAAQLFAYEATNYELFCLDGWASISMLS